MAAKPHRRAACAFWPCGCSDEWRIRCEVRRRDVGAIGEDPRMAFQPKYSGEQRAAIIRAVVDEDREVPAVVQAAAAGELGPAFALTPGAAYSIAARERQRRYSELPLRTVADDLVRRSLQLMARELDRLEGLPQLGPADVRALRDVWKLARLATTGPLAQPREAAAQDPSTPAGAQRQGLAARIAAQNGAAEGSGDDAAEDARRGLAASVAGRSPSPELAARVRASRTNGHAPQSTA